ncbi:beta strand repeat-containing protein [Cylindrospermopsis curvispora]|uniref:Calx-beta domain-containing protein n=1 Tax=Cylindrospermopsis curvispora GIHE-G1 TaxID=2666332 RepID=A0A7H0F4M7_9CYAN|nr:Calx-beta domain-containing protein [Cylindrospermopsis curvispora]QNP30993.1 hypothetical protein IAR63_08475 [Cylindrospermopsis curvispora GIHE-G1]
MSILSQINLLQDNGGNPGDALTSTQLISGSTFWVEIQLQDSRTNSAGIVGAALNLNWDPNSLTAISATVTSSLPFSQLIDFTTPGIAKVRGGSLPIVGIGQAIGKDKFERFAFVQLTTKSNLNATTSLFTIIVPDIREFSTADGDPVLNGSPLITLVNPTSTIPENTSTSTPVKVADLIITDDIFGNNTTSLSGPDASSFEIRGNELYLKAGTPLNYNTKSSYSVILSVNDTNINKSDSKTFNLSVTPVILPSLSITATNATQTEGNSGAKTFTFTVARTGDTSNVSSANWAVTGSGTNQANATDFGGTLPTGMVSFAASDTTQIITFNVLGDTTVEPDEGFTVSLSNPTNATISTGTATGTIQNDDSEPANITLSLNPTSVTEDGVVNLVYSFTRTGATGNQLTVNVNAGGTAVLGRDFSVTGPIGQGNLGSIASVTFAEGFSTATVTVDPIPNSIIEGDKTVFAILAAGAGYTIGTVDAVTGTILEDDVVPPQLAIAPTNAIQTEGNTGIKPFTFTAIRSGDTSSSSSANWAVTGSGTNQANATDFGGTSGAVSFAAGETSQIITLNVLGDSTVEPDEGFTVSLSNPTNATITTGTATGTITNDDVVPPQLAIAPTNAIQTEGNTGIKPFTFTAIRSGDTSSSSSANWAVTGSGTNQANATDFGGTSGAVSFAAGETSQIITLNVLGDSTVEPDEGFTVSLSNPTNATITTGTATGTITNDDVVPPQLAIAPTNAIQTEGNTGIKPFTFTAIRSGDTSSSSSANWAVTGSGTNQANATDFGGTSGAVSFAAGETSQIITLNVLGDSTVEPDEGFTVSLSNPTNATITTGTATGTITNDDVVPPQLAIAPTNAIQTEGNTGIKPFTFTVTRSGDTSSSSSANWAVTGSGTNQANATDFGGTSGAVSFAAGETSQIITLNVLGDSTVEPDEGFTVSLSNPTNATITTGTATGTITNDDVVPPQLAIAPTNAIQTEGNTGIKPFTFTVTRSGDTSSSSSANWAVTGSGTNQANATDFGGTSGAVSFAAGETSQIITLNVLGDSTVEPDEGFTVSLSNPTNATITTGTATGTITNDDVVPPQLAIAPTNAIQTEGNTGIKPFTFTVTRSGDTSSSSSANWAVTGSGTNQANATDFGGTSGAVSFAAGETSQIITLNVLGDSTVEPDEGFTVSLSNPTNATITTGTATGTITNDDVVPPQLAIAPTNAIQTEGNTGIKPFTFTVTRSGDTSSSSSANWAVTGSGTNQANATDFGGTSGAVSFAAGETSQIITLNVLGDSTVEPDEGFTVSLSNPTNATITTGTATGTITNDDVVPPQLAIAPTNAIQTEGNTGIKPFTFTVTRSGDTSSSSSANWAVTGSGTNQANATDFGGTSGAVSFAAGETSQIITLNVLGDSTVEPDEGFTVSLSNPTNATITTGTATGTITNDDVVPPQLAIAPTNAIQTEGNTGIKPFTFTVTRSGDTSSSSSANWAVTGSGTNQANATDFGGTSGAVSFAVGETSQIITLNVLGDSTVEPDEGFTVSLSNPTNANITTGTATGTITNDDVPTITPSEVRPKVNISTGLVFKTNGRGTISLDTNRLSAIPDEVIGVQNGTKSNFKHLFGLYEVTDAQGGIDTNGDGIADLKPGDSNPSDYAFHALTTARVKNFTVQAGGNDAPSTATQLGSGVSLEDNKFYAPFVIANAGTYFPGSQGIEDFVAAENGDIERFSSAPQYVRTLVATELDNLFNNSPRFIQEPVAYFSFGVVNRDQSPHFRSYGNGVYGFEDLPANATQYSNNDFDDAVFALSFT